MNLDESLWASACREAALAARTLREHIQMR